MTGTYKHWCYPSAIIGCRQDISSLRGDEITFLRSQVTCPACLRQLRADEEICEACKLGAPEAISTKMVPPHVCDPELS
jgi:hypothetical protein